MRAFVPEAMLARAVRNAVVRVFTDGRPGRPYERRIGQMAPRSAWPLAVIGAVTFGAAWIAVRRAVT